MELDDCSKNKVVLVGDFGVGKTALFMRFKTGRYVRSTDSQMKRNEAEHLKTWTKNGKERFVSDAPGRSLKLHSRISS